MLGGVGLLQEWGSSRSHRRLLRTFGGGRILEFLDFEFEGLALFNFGGEIGEKKVDVILE